MRSEMPVRSMIRAYLAFLLLTKTLSQSTQQTQQTAAPAEATTTTSTTAAIETTTTTTTEEATTTSTTTTTSSTTTTTNGLPENPAINQICPSNTRMNDRIRTVALNATNYRRSRLAQGLVRKNNGNLLPPATNMRRLVYDCTLENSAKASVERCSPNPSQNLTADVKENIHRVPQRIAIFRKHAMLEAIKHWWRQVRLVDGIGMQAMFRAHHQDSTIQYFTLMAWATTEHIGCAVSQKIVCRDGYWYVACHYKIGGNVVDNNVYQPGSSCSECPAGTTCDSMKLCS
ncbi:SCP domain-containing protein [Trichostrongylus colubriformis]|uniref:SCP domain-containing protein n=1 Tax=Trichostrongylus colubriformis TaxID=6319 RepID=A0AAN8ENV4_TRICO